MSSRTVDWTPLGLEGDPAPGSPDVLCRIEQDFRQLGEAARQVNTGLDAVLRTAEAGGFRGATAEALRGEISDRLKRFIANVAASFEVAEAGVVRYRAALESVQQATAAALEEARGLAPEDPRRGLLRGRAEAERDWLVAEARRLERSLGDAADMVSQPIKVQSGVLKFLDIALVVAAAVLGVVGVFTGGALAMVALGLNAGLFLKSAIQYARGEVPLWEMLLSGLGLLCPSTKGLGFGWLKGPAQAVLRGSRSVLRQLGHGAAVEGRTLLSPAAVDRLVKQGVLALPKVLYGASTEAFQAIRALPGAVGRNVAAVPGLVSGAGGWVKGTWRAGVMAVGDDFVRVTAHLAADGGGLASKLGVYAVTNAGRSFDLAVSALLPLNFVEIRQLGYAGAFHVAVERAGHLTYMGTGAATRLGAEAALAGIDLGDPATVGAARTFAATAPDTFFATAGRSLEMPPVKSAAAVTGLDGAVARPSVPELPGLPGARDGAGPVSGAQVAARPGANTDLVSPQETALGRWEELNRSTGWQSRESGVLVRPTHAEGTGLGGAGGAADPLPGITESHVRSLLDGEFQVLADGAGGVTVRIGEDAAAPPATGAPVSSRRQPAAEPLAEGGADDAAGGAWTSLTAVARADARHAALDLLDTSGRASPDPAPADAPGQQATGPAGSGTGADPAAAFGPAGPGSWQESAAGLDTAGRARLSASAGFAPIGLHESAMRSVAGGPAGLPALSADQTARRLLDTAGSQAVTPEPSAAAAQRRLAEADVLSAMGSPGRVGEAGVGSPGGVGETGVGSPGRAGDAGAGSPGPRPEAPAAGIPDHTPEEFAARAGRWREFRQTRDLKYARRLDWYATGPELDFEAARARFGQADLFGGAHLTDGGPVLKQVREEFHNDVREVFESGWQESGGVPAVAGDVWGRKLAELRSGLPDRLARASERQRRLAAFDRHFEQVHEVRACALDGRLNDERLAEFHAAERAAVGETVDEVWKQTEGYPGWWRGPRLDDALARLYPGLPERLRERLGLWRYLDQGELGLKAARETWDDDLAAGGPLGDAVMDRVRDEFTTDLRAAWQTLSGEQPAQRQAALDDLTNALPARFRHAEFRERWLARARQALDDAYVSFEDDLLRGGVRLGAEAGERLADEWTKAVETAVDEYWFSVPGNRSFRGPAAEPPTGTLPPGVSWDEHFAQLTGTLPHRLEHEATLNIVLQRAADDFHQIVGHPGSPLDPEPPAYRRDGTDKVLEALAEDFREETVTEYDRIWGPEGHDTEAWLRHEADHENAFDAALLDLRRAPRPPSGADRPAPRPEDLEVSPQPPQPPAVQPSRPDVTRQAQRADQPRPAGNDGSVPRTAVPEQPTPSAPAHTWPPDRAADSPPATSPAREHTPKVGEQVQEYAKRPPKPPLAPRPAPALATKPKPAPVLVAEPAAAGERTGTVRPQVPALISKPAPRPEAEHPWYVDRDALGEVTVMRADEISEGLARQWAHRIAHAVSRPGDGDALRAGIDEGIRELLSGGAPDAGHTAPQAGQADHAEHPADAAGAVTFWEEALQQGRLTLANGHVVWLRPVLRDLEPAPAEPKRPGVKEQILTWANLTSTARSQVEKGSGADATLLTALSTSARAASVVCPAAPVLGVGACRSAATTSERYLQATRKVLVGEHRLFHGGVHVRVFVDGVERPHEVVTATRVTVGLPSWFSTPGGPRPDAADSSNLRDVTGRRSHQAPEVINAVDLVPLTAKLQRHLLEAGLPARGVHEVMKRVLPQLNERGAINRSRHLLTNGVVSDRIRFPVGPARSFEGHLVIRATIERLQYLGDAPKVEVREDFGGRWRSAIERGTGSLACAGVLAVVGGQLGDESFLPSAALTGLFRRDTGHNLTESFAVHTIANTTGDQARYRAQVGVTAEVRSTTHRIPVLRHLVESEIGVPASESADFERRMFGADVRPPRQAPAKPDGPVEAQPYVRMLLRQAGLALPGSAYRRPARLDWPLPDPHPREPLALAARRGQGFGVATALPGAELVHDQVRGALERWHNRLSKGAKADWSAPDQDLLAWFSRPALESDLPQLLSGVEHPLRLGGRSYDVSVRAYLLDRVGGRTDDQSYPMKINARASQSVIVAGHRGTRRGVCVSVGGRLRVGATPGLRLQLGAARADMGAGGGVEDEFSGEANSAQRTETSGSVDEHVYDTVYEVSVRSGRHPAERWWIDRPGDAVARLVVPHQHVPSTPLSAREVRAAGRVSQLTSLPDGPAADFRSHGTGAVYRSFLHVPELSETAARMYQKAGGLPEEWLADRANWPAGIKAMFNPTALAADFGALAGGTGRLVRLPTGKGGWKQALRVRMTGHEPRHVAAHVGPGRQFQLWQYSCAGAEYRHTASSDRWIGVEASAGPQFYAGGSDDENQGTGTSTGGPHGRVLAIARGELAWQSGTERSVSVTPAEFGRIIHTGPSHTYRADPVFEVTLYRWGGRGLKAGTIRTRRYVRVKDGMDFVVPQRRIFDLGLPVPEGVAQVLPHEPTGYADPVLIPSGTCPEVLHADGVLVRMKQWLAEQGLLRTMGDGDEHRPDLLLKQLEGSFSPEALLTQFTLLTTTGVSRWIPLPGAFGSTWYLWAHVSAETGPPVSQLDRPELLVIKRGNAITERGHRSTTSRVAGVGAQLRARGDGTGYGGLRLGAGYCHGSGTGVERSRREVKMYWGQNKGGSQEFEHPQTYRIRMGITAELPEALSAPVRGIRAVVLGVADRFGHGRDAADWWHGHAPFVKRFPAPDQPDAGTVKGGVRLIVPDHLVVHDAPLPEPAPAHGTSAVWESGPTGRQSVRSPADRELVNRLVEAGHPWALPAAAAVRRWAALTAAPFRPPRDLTAPDAWRVPGLDFTTVNGLRYTHFTSGNLLRLNLGPLLRHRYEIPFDDHTITVGLEITRTEPLTPGEGPTLVTRHYKQDRESSQDLYRQSRGWYAESCPEGDVALGDDRNLMQRASIGYLAERSHEQSGELENITERNKTTTRPFRYYKADVRLVMTGPHGRLLVEVPDGLYFMLPTDTAHALRLPGTASAGIPEPAAAVRPPGPGR